MIAPAIGATLRFILPLAILGAAAWAALYLSKQNPDVKRKPSETIATLVRVEVVQPQDERIMIRAFGTVRPHRQATLQAQVGGRIVKQHPELTLGGIIVAGTPLLEIDERDYRIRILERKTELARAETELQLELGRARVAQREWKMLEKSIVSDGEGRELALRKPQLAEKRSLIAGIKSRIEQAELDLSRTVILSPFNSLVLEESVEVGELVRRQSSVARLACVDDFHVDVSLPLRDLELIAKLTRTGKTVSVRVRQELSPGRAVYFDGVVERLLGALVAESRMARVLVRVEDPLRIESKDPAALPLLLGSYVEVEIKGPVLKSVFVLPRSQLRQGDKVWVMTAGSRLTIRDVEIVDRQDDRVLISGGLEAGDRVVANSLPLAVEGMKIKVESDENAEAVSASENSQ